MANKVVNHLIKKNLYNCLFVHIMLVLLVK